MNDKFRCLDAGVALAASRSAFRRVTRIDDCPDLFWLDDDAGRERLADFHDGHWHMIGVQAAATILIPLGRHFVMQTLTSPGLWGIESDSDDAYLDQVFAEECDTLVAMLGALGVSVTA